MDLPANGRAAWRGALAAALAGLAAGGALATVWPAPGRLSGVSAADSAGRDRVTVTLHSAALAGTTVSQTWVTANLSRLEAGGERRAFGGATSGPDGTFKIHLAAGAGGPPMPALPGDRLIVAFGMDREPHAFVVPGLTAVPDAATDAVAGFALPETALDVTVDGRPGLRRHVVADAGGAYRASFAGDHNLGPGSSGIASSELANGDAVAVAWAVPYVNIELEQARVTGFGARGHAVAVHVWRGDRVVGTGTAVVDDGDAGGAPNWACDILAGDAEPVAVRGGDRLAVVLAGWAFEVDVPRLTVEANPAADRVSGSAPAGAVVRLTLTRGATEAVVDVAADATGRFARTLGAEWDLRANDAVAATVRLEGGHAATARVRVPGLAVNLDLAVVSGHAGPHAVVTATLRGAAEGPVRATGYGVADAAGRFELPLADGAGRSVRPAEGDGLDVRSGGLTTRMTIPRLTAVVNSDADAVSGDATPGGEVGVTATRRLGGREERYTEVAVPDGAGRYVASLAGGIDVAAGTHLAVRYRFDDGHVAWLERRVPLAQAQRGGNLVSGWVAPGASVQVGVAGGAGTSAAGQTTALADGAFDAAVLRSDGSAHRLDPGDDVVVTWDNGAPRLTDPAGTLRFAVAPLSATLAVSTGRLTGTAPPGTPVDVVPGGLGGAQPVGRVVADAAGTFTYGVPAAAGGRPLDAGSVVEAAVVDATGLRTYVRSVAPYLEVTLGARQVRGAAAPLSTLGLESSRGGAVDAGAAARSDTYGTFGAQWRRADGSAGRPLPGDEVALVEPGGRRTRLRLPEMSIAVDVPGDALFGTGPATVPLDLRLGRAGLPDLLAETWTDAAGRWRVAARELPAGTVLAELTQAEAHVRIGNGHRVIALAIRSPTPTATPIDPSPTPHPRTATATSTVTPSPTATEAPGSRLSLPAAYRNSGARPRR